MLDDPRRRFVGLCIGWLLASFGGWWIGSRHASEPLSPKLLRVLLGTTLLLRGWAWWSAPALSEDVFRYVFEGTVVWFEGPAFPFLHPPAQAPALVPSALLGNIWLRINHPEISTIYPPFAQLVFALAGGLGLLLGDPLRILKLLLIGADLAVARCLGPRALPWLLSPLVILEIGREGHADSLSALGLILGATAFVAGRPARGYGGWVLAALAKLNGLVVLPAALRATRQGTWILLGLVLLAVPWIVAGPTAGVGLSEYASRWRAGDGAFSLVLATWRTFLGGEWTRWGDHTFTIHQLARATVLVAWLGFAALVLRKTYPLAAIPAKAASLLFALLLLSPTLHPWYLTWLLPLACLGFSGTRAVYLLATLAVFFHHPTWLELTTGTWTDLPAVRAAVHLPVWALWAYDASKSA